MALSSARPNVANGLSVAAKGAFRVKGIASAGFAPVEIMFITVLVAPLEGMLAPGAAAACTAIAMPRNDWSLRRRLALLSSLKLPSSATSSFSYSTRCRVSRL